MTWFSSNPKNRRLKLKWDLNFKFSHSMSLCIHAFPCSFGKSKYSTNKCWILLISCKYTWKFSLCIGSIILLLMISNLCKKILWWKKGMVFIRFEKWVSQTPKMLKFRAFRFYIPTSATFPFDHSKIYSCR